MLKHIFLFIFMMFMSVSAALHAHELRPAIVTLELAEDGAARMSIDLNLEAELAGIGDGHDDTTQAPEAEAYEALRALSAGALLAALQQGDLNVEQLATVPGTTITLSETDIPATGDLEFPRHSILTFDVRGLASAQSQLTWSGTSAPAILRVDGANGEQLHSEFLQPGFTSGPFDATGGAAQSLWAVFANYIVVGFEHIIPLGLDHILFVVGLFLLSTRLQPLLWQITAFTLAHTVTLALGTLGVVNIPGSIVEPLIALSIAYVCVENVAFKTMTKWRPAVVFCFGLLHGLGFAGVLGEVGLSGEYLIASLIAFNVGVEIGQLTVIAACMLVVGFWFGQKSWYRAVVVIPGSVIIGSIGLFWFVERIGFV